MDFTLTETQSLLKDTADRLVREKYTFDDRKKIVSGEKSFSPALWDEFAALGLLGVEIPEDCGGIGGSFADLAIVLEAFGRGLVVEPYLSTVVIGAGLIKAAGGAQREELLRQIAAGKLKLAFAHGEAKARYALAHVETHAHSHGDAYVITGTKAVVLGADSADRLIVSARTDGNVTDRQGISLFLVDAKEAGMHMRTYRNMDDRGAAEVTLENVHVPASALLGPAGGALALIEAANDRGAAALCCDAIGAMMAVNECTIEYMKTRNQFGHPIGKFQVLQHRMADMVMAQEQARSMVYLAIDFANEPDAAARAQSISAAKVQISHSGQIVARGAVQLHGGIGLTIELNVGHYMRRLTSIEKMFGDIDWHMTRFAAA